MAEGTPQVEKSDTTRFLEAAKDFSFEQKLSVVQSILCKIPQERQEPWNISHKSKKIQKNDTGIPPQTPPSSFTTSGANNEDDGTVTSEAVECRSVTDTVLEQLLPDVKPQAPPLIDPYRKAMKYYEKHLVLNHFQVNKIHVHVCR